MIKVDQYPLFSPELWGLQDTLTGAGHKVRAMEAQVCEGAPPKQS
jgi:hypothetical protein